MQAGNRKGNTIAATEAEATIASQGGCRGQCRVSQAESNGCIAAGISLIWEKPALASPTRELRKNRCGPLNLVKRKYQRYTKSKEAGLAKSEASPEENGPRTTPAS